MPDTGKMVDLGTIDDMDGIPGGVERDYEHLIVFGRRLDRGMWTWLRQRIDEGERQVDAYEAAVEKCNACTFPASCSEFGRCVLEAPVAECGYCTTRITLLGGMWTGDDGTTACTDASAPYVPHRPKEG